VGYVVGRITWFNTVCGNARSEEDGQEIFLHQNQRVHPYASDHVRYAHSVSDRHPRSGMNVRMRIYSSSTGLRAREWMFLDDYERAKKKAAKARKEKMRRRNPR